MPNSISTPKTQVGLNLEVILDAAERLVAAEGYDALSMRRLARDCGVGAMTLYGYVRTKEELLEGLATRLLQQVKFPDAQAGEWDERIRQLFGSVREVFLEHPELLQIVAVQRLEGVGAYRGAEATFGALRDAGLGDVQVLQAFDALVSFTVGFVQREVGLDRTEADALPGLRRLPRDEYPHVMGLAGQLMTRDSDAGFHAGLELLIAGISNWVTR